jgi:hypothetical protein
VELKPPDKFELNRMAHARAQELNLPAWGATEYSPSGKSGHGHLSLTAKMVFGQPSWSLLNPNQMESVVRFMDEKRRLPGPGEV